MKPNSGITLAVLLTGAVMFFAGALLARVFPDGDSKHLYDLAIAAVGALAGTVAGALVALNGDRKRRAKEAEDRNITAANLAIFELGRVYNFLAQYQRDVIEPHRGKRLQWLLMARSRLTAPIVEMNFSDLAFLFSSKDPNVVSEVAVEIERFVGIVTTIAKVESDLHTEAHPRMEARRILEGAAAEEIESACGVRIVSAIRTNTNSLVEYVDLNAPSVLRTVLKVQDATRAMYPHRRVVSFAGPSPSAQAR